MLYIKGVALGAAPCMCTVYDVTLICVWHARLWTRPQSDDDFTFNKVTHKL